jgi:hypothetical protein
MVRQRPCRFFLFIGALYFAFTSVLGNHRSNSETFLFAKCGVCKALARELHLEVLRHDLNKDGEEGILDSTEAACLGVVQNYTIQGEGRSVTVEHSPEKERLEAGFSTEMVQAALFVKQVCETVSEEISMELSETIWHSIRGKFPPDDSAKTLCVDKTDMCSVGAGAKYDSSKKARAGRKRQKKEGHQSSGQVGKGDTAKDTEDSMREMFQKMDKDGSMSTLLMKEMQEPELMLPDEDKAEIKAAKDALKCPSCVALVYGTLKRARETPGGRALRSEADLGQIVERVCDGPVDASSASGARMMGVPPPLWPPRWSDFYKVFRSKKMDKWVLKHRKKPISLKKALDRRRWSSKLSKEKLIIRGSCKNVVEASTDVIAEELFRALNHLPKACRHVNADDPSIGVECVPEQNYVQSKICKDHCTNADEVPPVFPNLLKVLNHVDL